MDPRSRLRLNIAAVVSLALFVWTIVAWSAQRDEAYALITSEVVRMGRSNVFVPGADLVTVSDPRYPLVTLAPADVGRYVYLPLGRVPVWLLLVATAATPAYWVATLARGRLGHARSRRSWRARNAGLCVGCGYDLRATPGRCPECGRLAETRTGGAPVPPRPARATAKATVEAADERGADERNE